MATSSYIMASPRQGHAPRAELVLPVIKSPRKQDPKDKKKTVTLVTESQVAISSPVSVSKSCDIFDEHWLVDSPRRILLEKTTLGMETTLSIHLDKFYANAAEIPDDEITAAQSEASALIEYIFPRIKKLGRKVGFKIKRAVFTGSAFDGTEVISMTDMDVLLEIEKDRSAYQNKGEGYKYIPLKKYREVEGGKPDAFRFGRSQDGRYLSSMLIAKNVFDVVERSLKLHASACMEPFCQEDGASQITVSLKDKYRIHITPAIYVEADDTYLVTRPYAYDENPVSDCLWRICHVNREKTIMNLMDKADRGVRCKAFKLLKALVRAEPTLHGIPAYHVKSVLLHTFDDTVDHMPRWQRTSIEACFQRLLRDLLNFYTKRNLPNFFLRNQNLLSHMPERQVSRLQSRLAFLASNQNELLRVLKKRSSEGRNANSVPH